MNLEVEAAVVGVHPYDRLASFQVLDVFRAEAGERFLQAPRVGVAGPEDYAGSGIRHDAFRYGVVARQLRKLLVRDDAVRSVGKFRPGITRDSIDWYKRKIDYAHAPRKRDGSLEFVHLRDIPEHWVIITDDPDYRNEGWVYPSDLDHYGFVSVPPDYKRRW